MSPNTPQHTNHIPPSAEPAAEICLPTPESPQPEVVARIPSKFISWWRRWTAGLSFGPVFVILSATLLLIMYHENGNTSFFRRYLRTLFDPSWVDDLYPAFYWYGMSLLMLGIIPLLLGRYVLRVPFKDWIGLGDVRFGLLAVTVLYLAFLIILIPTSLSAEFQSKYPLFFEAKLSTTHFVLHEIAYAIYFIGWEFIFRGYLLFGLKPAIGFYAVFVQTIPFAILHFGKPEIETFSAILAGIILGYLALRARSFWYGWMLHALIAVTNDTLAAWHTLPK
jgi:membrane protease YdiL (CAAX protease family)